MAKRKSNGNKRKSNKRASVITSVVILLFALCSFLYSYFTDTSNIPVDFGNSFVQTDGENLRVYYIDVGQGDCELIVCAGKSVLIDAGEADNANKVIKFIKDLGITKLDCIVATHPHSDHIGALPYIIDEIGMDNIIMPELAEENIPTTRVYEKFLNSVAQSGAAVHSAKPGDNYKYGDISFKILSPVFESDSELNNMSVVLRCEYGKTSFLFTGDAEKKVEKRLVENNGASLKSDIVKVGHHGSKTSSCEEFVRAVSPVYAVCCCGDGTDSHPHKSTVDRWISAGARFLRTDNSGTVVIISDGVSLTVETEK